MKRKLDALKDARIDEAAALAAGTGGPERGDFLRVFLARGAAEDVIAYTPAELAAFAAGAMDDLGARVAGHHRIRILDPDFPGAGTAHAGVTVIEMLNDDMPFLVDSTMQELTEAGADVRLLVHPILSVRRDGSGAFLASPNRGRRGPCARASSTSTSPACRTPPPLPTSTSGSTGCCATCAPPSPTGPRCRRRSPA